MLTYEDISKWCGRLGASWNYDVALVRDGEDIVALYHREETCRWTPNNTLTVTIPEVNRTYFQRVIWTRRFRYFTDCEITDRRKNLSSGITFILKFCGKNYAIVSTVKIDIPTSTLTVLDPLKLRKIDQRAAKKVLLDAKQILRAAEAASKLMNEPHSWEVYRSLLDTKKIAAHILQRDVGALGTALAQSKPWIDDIDSLLRSAKSELYQQAEVFAL